MFLHPSRLQEGQVDPFCTWLTSKWASHFSTTAASPDPAIHDNTRRRLPFLLHSKWAWAPVVFGDARGRWRRRASSCVGLPPCFFEEQGLTEVNRLISCLSWWRRTALRLANKGLIYGHHAAAVHSWRGAHEEIGLFLHLTIHSWSKKKPLGCIVSALNPFFWRCIPNFITLNDQISPLSLRGWLWRCWWNIKTDFFWLMSQTEVLLWNNHSSKPTVQ